LENTPDFEIEAKGRISKEFLDRNILTFNLAATFVKQLAYGRNADKNNLVSVFKDQCGTCSTKHALLKRLAEENNYHSIKLIVGLFKMNKINTPVISKTLMQYNLEYIPEAHCYLKNGDQILDLTTRKSSPADFSNDLMEEIEIAPDQISEYKVEYHQNYLKEWLDQNNKIKLSLGDLWNIREKCIEDLSKNH